MEEEKLGGWTLGSNGHGAGSDARTQESSWVETAPSPRLVSPGVWSRRGNKWVSPSSALQRPLAFLTDHWAALGALQFLCPRRPLAVVVTTAHVADNQTCKWTGSPRRGGEWEGAGKCPQSAAFQWVPEQPMTHKENCLQIQFLCLWEPTLCQAPVSCTQPSDPVQGPRFFNSDFLGFNTILIITHTL